MLDALFGEQIAEGEAFIGGAIVGHDALDRDAQVLEPGQSPAAKGDGAIGPLVGQDFAVGQAGRVIDRDMQAFPPRCRACCFVRCRRR